MVYLSLLILPLFVAVGFFLFSKCRVTWKEFLLHCLIQVIVAGSSVAIISRINTSDTEVLNGRITKKAQERVSCRHSYTCNCITTCSGNSCSTVCSTCYEHAYDWDWAVYTTLGNRFVIRPVDSRGSKEPPRFTQVQIGEPYSKTNRYTNYVKASPGTLFKTSGAMDRFESKIPEYPLRIYDYHRLDRLVAVGVKVDDPKEWNDALSEANARLGTMPVKDKRSNAVVVLAGGLPQEFSYAIEQAWIGGKKNDIVVIVGVDEGLKPEWARVLAWTDHSIFRVSLRDAVLGMERLEPDLVAGAIVENVERHYMRKPMADFQYLAAQATPTPTQFMLSAILGLLVSFVVGTIFWHKDVFGDGWKWRRKHLKQETKKGLVPNDPFRDTIERHFRNINNRFR